MKKILIPAALMTLLTACSSVPPGNVGIRVNTMGMERGIEDTPLPVGWYYTGFTQTMYTFPTFAQPYVWTASVHEGATHDESMTFQDMEGTKCNADVGIQYSIVESAAPKLFKIYRKDVHTITHVILRNSVRDALIKASSKMHVSDIYGVKKEELIRMAEAPVKAEFEGVGIKIDKLYWVSDIRLPTAIQESLNLKIRANQIAEQKRNEIVQVEADASKAVAEAEGKKQASIKEAEGIAQRNLLITQSITPALIQYEMATKWNGVMPIMGATNNPAMLINPSDFVGKK